MSNQASGERTLGVSVVEFERAVVALNDALRAATPRLLAILAALQARPHESSGPSPGRGGTSGGGDGGRDERT